jgi:transmembrane sensor
MKKKDDSGKYAGFGVNDFICDEFFQDWTMRPNPESDAWWQEWKQEHPDKHGELEQARDLLTHIGFKEHWPSEEKTRQSLAASLATIAEEEGRMKMEGAGEDYNEKEERNASRRVVSMRSTRRVLAAASLIGILILAGILFYRTQDHQMASHATEYGAMKYVYLPDSSKVVLNGHSTVQYAKNWKEGSPRKLWLEGEAFFDVRHPSPVTGETKGYGSFQVYTKDLMVEVLGTEFDVRERRGRTEIVLASGKIRIHFLHVEQTDILMRPGDKIVYDPQQELITRQAVIPEYYISWKDKKLTNATGRQIVEYVEDNYGKKVILEDTSMASRQFGGDVLLDKFDDALFALSTVMNVQIIQKNDTLIFRPK